MALYGVRPDKGYGLTDCMSMQAMRREGLIEALTNDRHFEQKGFRAASETHDTEAGTPTSCAGSR